MNKNASSPLAPEAGKKPTSTIWRWAPLVVMVLAMAAAFSMGWHKLLSFKSIGLNYDALRVFIAEHFLVALSLYMLAYLAVVALSLPGGLVMTVSGGLLFGWAVGAPAAFVAATIGATLVFLVAKTSLGEPLAARAGPWLEHLRAGFAENALSYLLFLRLVPLFPFAVVNLAPAFLGVRLGTFVVGTLLGILPATLAFSVAGASLASIIEPQNKAYFECIARLGADATGCPYNIDLSAIVTKELLATFALLGLLALIPVALKSWTKPHAVK